MGSPLRRCFYARLRNNQFIIVTDSSDPIPPTDELTPRQWARRDRFVRILVISTGILFCAMVGLLFFKWLITNEPSSVAIVNLGPNLIGATAIIDGVSLDQPYRSAADPQTGSARFFLGPGRYTLRILYGQESRVLFETDFVMPANRAIKFDLADQLSPATQPSK